MMAEGSPDPLVSRKEGCVELFCESDVSGVVRTQIVT